MNGFPPNTLDDLLTKARAGDTSAVSALISQYRNYLALLARLQVGRVLQVTVDGSDLVQETCLRAYGSFEQFRGVTEAELMQWLRRIMACAASNMVRKYTAAKRDVRLERRLQAALDHSSQAIGQWLVADEPTPSENAARRERAKLLADALQQLPDDYREVLILHHLEGLSIAEAARHMGRTANAVQKLWARAIVRVRHHLREKV